MSAKSTSSAQKSRAAGQASAVRAEIDAISRDGLASVTPDELFEMLTTLDKKREEAFRLKMQEEDNKFKQPFEELINPGKAKERIEAVKSVNKRMESVIKGPVGDTLRLQALASCVSPQARGNSSVLRSSSSNSSSPATSAKSTSSDTKIVELRLRPAENKLLEDIANFSVKDAEHGVITESELLSDSKARKRKVKKLLEKSKALPKNYRDTIASANKFIHEKQLD